MACRRVAQRFLYSNKIKKHLLHHPDNAVLDEAVDGAAQPDIDSDVLFFPWSEHGSERQGQHILHRPLHHHFSLNHHNLVTQPPSAVMEDLFITYAHNKHLMVDDGRKEGIKLLNGEKTFT